MTEEAKAEEKKESKSDGEKKDASEKKVNPWLVVGVIAVIIILFYACRAPEQEVMQDTPEQQRDDLLGEQEPVTLPEPAEDIPEQPVEVELTLEEVFASEDAAHCTFTVEGVHVEMYKDHEKFRQVAEQNGLEVTTLHNEGIMYVWTADGVGKMVDLRELARSGLMENINEVPAQPSDEVMSAASDVECDDDVPADIFTPSPYVQFQDMNEALAQAVEDAKENAAYTSAGYQKPTI